MTPCGNILQDWHKKLMSWVGEVLPHQSDNPNIGPLDYYVFWSLTNFLVEKESQNEENIKNAISLYNY